MNQILKFFIFFIVFIFFTACSRDIPTLEQRINSVKNISKLNSLNSKIYYTKKFDIYSLQTSTLEDEVVDIYIEGDGLAWITRTQISLDPTPTNPLTLKLMIKDNSKVKIYLGRVCQYIQNKNCDNKYWTSHRFSLEVIESYIEILDQIKSKHKNIKRFNLYGYSGGATVALLLASKRDDIKKIVTIAGNLDIKKWTQIKNITPLVGSLNPADYIQKLQNIKQIHLVGQIDNIINKSILDSYLQKFSKKENISYIVYDNFSHNKGWIENWNKILDQIN